MVEVLTVDAGEKRQTADRPQRLIRIDDVVEKVALSPATIYRRIREGTFPRQRQIGHGVAWVEAEIDEWILSLPVA